MPLSTIPFTYLSRDYLHFDAPLSAQVAEGLVTNPTVAARHPFFPLITVDVITEKIRKRAGGGVEYKPPKVRPICYAAHKDSHILAHYSEIFGHLYELRVRSLGLGGSITAFRSLNGWSNIHFANEVFEFIREVGVCFVTSLDVTDFFNQIDHRQLKRSMAEMIGEQALPADVYNIYKAITRYSAVNRDRLMETLRGIERPRSRRLCSAHQLRTLVRGNGLCFTNREGKGIPQGSPISAVLANVYMLPVDELIQNFVSTNGGLYRRYCDDLILVLPTAPLRAEALAMVMNGLLTLGLSAHPDKRSPSNSRG